MAVPTQTCYLKVCVQLRSTVCNTNRGAAGGIGSRGWGSSGTFSSSEFAFPGFSSDIPFVHPAFQLCFNCRKPGHGLADCPEADRDEEMGRGICYRCGSTEHEIQRCRAKVDPALGKDQARGPAVDAYRVVLLTRSRSFPSRWLPVRQVLHLQSDGTLVQFLPWQPQRTLCQRYERTQTLTGPVDQLVVHPLKMFPFASTGGCCRVCGSVEHFQKDCPEHQAAGETLAFLQDFVAPLHSVVSQEVFTLVKC